MIPLDNVAAIHIPDSKGRELDRLCINLALLNWSD